jgi:hypothetical protein
VDMDSVGAMEGPGAGVMDGWGRCGWRGRKRLTEMDGAVGRDGPEGDGWGREL